MNELADLWPVWIALILSPAAIYLRDRKRTDKRTSPLLAFRARGPERRRYARSLGKGRRRGEKSCEADLADTLAGNENAS